MLNWLRALLRPVPPPTWSPNTFVVWEPCTHSHAEVVPGFVHYLLELGFEVAVLATPKRFDEGLFSRFNHPQLTLHRYSQHRIRRLFSRYGMGNARGVLITTARKISGKHDYQRERHLFARRQPNQALLLVEHDVKPAADCGALTPDIITLRAAHYGQAHTTVVNPHYFGQVAITAKHAVTRFITIGAMRSKRRNTQLLIKAVQNLHNDGVRNFRISVIGRGDLRGVPPELQPYFEIKGRVDFSTLYAEMEAADFFLTLLDPDTAAHERYITTGTSGSFQLIYGFRTPCLIPEKFAAINGFTPHNSLVYADNQSLGRAMQQAISLSDAHYAQLQQKLAADADRLAQQSLHNLSGLINLAR